MLDFYGIYREDHYGREKRIALIDFIFPCDLGKTNTASLGIASIKGSLIAGIERKIEEIISNGGS